MFLKFGFAAALILAASPIAAQKPAAAPPAPQPTDPHETEVKNSAMAFGQCIKAGLDNLPASVTPEAGAATILGGCTAQRNALAKAVDGLIETLPEEQKAAAHTQFNTQIGQAQVQIADAIRRHRAEAAEPAAPATPSH